MSDLKLPPQDIEAEQSVLGALMISKNAIIKVADFLSAEDFYKSAHQKIYASSVNLFERGEPIDILSLTAALKKKKQLEDAGGASYLAQLANAVPSASHVAHYAKIIREKKVLRDLINASNEISEHAFESVKDVEDLLDNIEQKIFAISQRSLPQKFTSIKDELKDAYERIEKLHKGEGALRGVTTGFNDLDNILSGFQKSDLIVVGARPSLGKTAFVLDIARAAAKENAPVGVFSLEMSREQIIDRLIGAEAQVPLWRLRTGRLQDETEFAMIQEALDCLSRLPIFVEDLPSPNILQMRAMARRLQAEHGLGLLIVDYLQLIHPRASGDFSMVQQITEISRGLKSLARELNVPVLAVSQLSRAVDQREVRIPRLSDLRESGAIEQDADVVLFIYRKDRDKPEVPLEEQNTAEIIVAKHRNGPLGTVRLKFDPEKVSFKNIDKFREE